MSNNQSASKSQLLSQGQGNMISNMDGELVMLSIHNGKYYNLGELGGEIWELMSNPISIQAIVTALQSRYDVGQEECEEQVATFIGHLREEGLIRIEES